MGANRSRSNFFNFYAVFWQKFYHIKGWRPPSPLGSAPLYYVLTNNAAFLGGGATINLLYSVLSIAYFCCCELFFGIKPTKVFLICPNGMEVSKTEVTRQEDFLTFQLKLTPVNLQANFHGSNYRRKPASFFRHTLLRATA